MGVQGDVMRSDRLKQVMQQIDPNFEERNAGFNRFSRFVTKAATRGLLVCTKLENGQYQVAPVGDTAPPAEAEKKSRRAPASATPATAPAEKRTRKRTRGGRGGQERTERPERPERTERSERPKRSQPSASQGRGRLTLAKAFSLMSEALQQMERPVDHETLRLRMVTIHGKEDGLLEASRFQRLLRQANDAEVADVRKVGEDGYEVDLTAVAAEVHKAVELSAAQAKEEAAEDGKTPSKSETAKTSTPTDGRRRTLRPRRGSRAPVAAGATPDIPMVGVVKLDTAPAAKTTAKKAAKKSSAKKKPKARKPAAAATRKKTAPKKAAKKKVAKRRSGAKKTSKKAAHPATSEA